MRRAFLSCCLAWLVLAGEASAQTYTWNGGAGNGNWSSSANWSGGQPTSSTTTIIELDGTSQTSTIQDISSPFQLNQLVMLTDATNGFVVGGSALQFAGAAPTLETRSAALLQVAAPIDFSVSSLINPTVNNPSGAEVRLSGALTAAAGITVTVGSASSPPAAMVVIDGNNPGFAGTWAVTNGTITQTAGVNPLSRAANVVTSGTLSNFTVGTTTASGFSDSGTSLQLRTLSGSGQFQVGTTLSASSVAVGFGDGDFSITGAGSLAAGNAGSHLAKVGIGTFTLSGGQAAFSGSISVRDGVVALAGSSAVAGGFGTASTGPITVYAGAELRQSMTGTQSNGRIGNSQPIILNGGLLHQDSSGLGTSATGYSEVAGALSIGAGQSTIRIDTNANRGSRFNFASLTSQSNTGTLFFQSGNLGGDLLNTAGSGNVAFVTPPTLMGTTDTYGANTTDLKILPYGFAATSSTGAPATLVTYDSGNGSIRALANTNYAAAFGTATDNVSLNSATSLSGAATANALRLTTGGSVDIGANGLTISTGALLNAGGGDVTGAGTLNFGTGGASTAFVTTNGAMTIACPIAATNLSKNGAGNLTLSGNSVTLSAASGNGVVAVNAGTLTVAGAAFTNAQTFQVSRGATLTADLIVGSNQTLTGAGTVSGNVTATGATITPSALGGPGADLASPATLSIAGNLALNGGSNFRWFVSSAVTDANSKSPYTASMLSVSGTLDLSGASSSNKITIQPVSLGLSNAAGPVYDLNKLTDTRSWVIVEASGGITGFASNKFTVDTTSFANLQPGENAFSISQVGNSLVLTFNPVPEPGTTMAIAVGGLAAIGLVRRRLRSKSPATVA